MKENAKDNLYQIVKFVESQDMEKEIDIKMIVPYLNKYMKIREIPKNHYITREQEMLNKVYYIICGAYDMTRLSEKGKMKVQAQRRAPQFIGIDKAIDKNMKGNFTSIALEKCTVLEIDQKYFVECIKENGDLAIKLIKNISEKLVNASLEIDRLVFNTPKEQLMHYIYQYWKESPAKHSICRIEEKNSYTADNVGISIRTFYRVLDILKKEKLVCIHKGCIEVDEKQIKKRKELLSLE